MTLSAYRVLSTPRTQILKQAHPKESLSQQCSGAPIGPRVPGLRSVVLLSIDTCDPSPTEDVSFITFLTSSPKQPKVFSPFHILRASPRPCTEMPTHLTNSWASLVSCMSYFRCTSSSGKRRQNTVAVVPLGRGEYRRRNSTIQFSKVRRLRFELQDDFRVFRCDVLDISCNNDTKLELYFSIVDD